MNVIPYTIAQQELVKTMQSVCKSHAPVVIKQNKTTSVVMISLEDFNALQETAYLLRSPANAAYLAEALDEVEAMIAQKKIKKIHDF